MTLSALLLALALFGLLLGPFAHKWTERSRTLHAAMDGFTVVAIGGLALLELAPNALTGGGLLAALFLVAGFALPMWLHRIGDLGQFSDRILVIFLTLHTMVESAALATADAHSVEALGLAIVAHQLPVGLAAFSLASHPRAGWISVLVIGLGMIVGFFGGEAAATAMTVEQNAWLQAMAAGSLLHVLSGHEEPRETSAHEAVNHGHGHSHGHSHAPPPASGNHAHAHASEGATTQAHGHAHASEVRPSHGHAPAHGHAHGRLEAEESLALASLSLAHRVGPDHHGHGHAHSPPESEADHGHAASDQSAEPTLVALGPRATSSTLVRSLLTSTSRARAGFVGGTFGLLLVVATFLGEHGPEHHEGEFFGAVIDLALDSAPALLFGYLCAAFVVWALAARRVQALSSPRRLSQALGGVAYGLPLPICSCSILSVYTSLVRSGVSPAASVAFLIATPELGMDAVLISLPLLGGPLTLTRVGLALGIAIGTGLILSSWMKSQGAFRAPPPEPKDRPNLWSSLEFGFVELFDHTMPWIALGMLLAGLFEPLLAATQLSSISPWLQVPLFALVGLPVYMCASGATPIAAVAIAHAVSPGAALAFLLTGPATNLTTFSTFERLYGRTVALLLGFLVFALAVLGGYATHFAFGAPVSAQVQTTATHEHQHSLLAVASLAILLALFSLSVFRQGPRGTLRQLRPTLL